MGSPAELSLDCKSHGSQLDQTQKLEEFLSRLEEERLKIDAFKRELPLCMQLLNNAMEAYRQQLVSYQEQRPVQLEEFIPIKQTTSDGKPSTNSEKSSWMTSAQLWTQQSTNVDVDCSTNGVITSPRLALDGKQRNGGAFIPFSKDKSLNNNLPDLSLSNSKESEEKKCPETSIDGGLLTRSRGSGGDGRAVTVAAKEVKTRSEGQAPMVAAPGSTQRKARRCWSPDLHRRFVNALQMLGGSQVATPKQIRELMKVDGLTNDEVKSHLQKYRLHTRRPIPAPQTAAVPPQLVVLGGIWVPPEYAAGTAIYGAHPSTGASTHYCAAAPVTQDFYPPPAPHHRHNHHPASAPMTAQFNQRSAIMAYKGARNGSPESDVKNSGGERSESMEDGEDGIAGEEEEEEEGKSDSGNWKVGEEKRMVPVRVDGDVSNVSEVTLKF